MSVSINGTGGLTFSDSSVQSTAATGFGFKNRIINGAMVIDQRNAGASVTPSVTNTVVVDRWICGLTQASKFSVQQNAGSVTPPVGFANYSGITSTSAYSVTSGDIFYYEQRIEQNNVSDLAFGTANAAAITLSFWVRSSLTGTFGGALRNHGNTRSYPFTYTISVANTWEQKTITVAGDTTGTWATTSNLAGLRVTFGLGGGSTYSGAAGSWASAEYYTATGATSVVGTNGATFYITGVQLEKGSTATSFDYRPYGTELALCQRYLPAFSGAGNWFGFGIGNNSTSAYCTVQFPVPTRVAPTGITVSNVSHFNVTDAIAVNSAATSISFNNGGVNSALLVIGLGSGITSARPTTLSSNSSSANLYFNGCEL